MRYLSIFGLSIVCAFIPAESFAQFSVECPSSCNRSVITPAKTTGLETVLVVEDASEAHLVYKSATGNQVTWKKFGSSGAGFAEPLEAVNYNGAISSISLNETDMGYIVVDNNRQIACWVVNYANHIPTISSISLSTDDNECDRAFINAIGGFDRINYFSINGQPIELDRHIILTYHDLKENDERTDWISYEASKSFSSVANHISVEAPLCNGRFNLTGDRFLEEWGTPIELSTDTYETHRVSAITSVEQEERSNDNESGTGTGALGGSAPCNITFKAVPTDAVVFREWQFSAAEDFNDILDRYNVDEFSHIFDEYGTIYARYIAADVTGECTFESEVYTIAIGESKLECPNAFSPLNEDGVNDIWKVSYSSLVSYECHIFNRWGTRLFSSTNPAEGWDGKYKGKFVKPGVFFYVIKAKGADGHLYNLSGDINIVGSRLNPNYSSASE